MYDLQIIPPKDDKKTGCEPCSPCGSDKPRYPKLCLSGTAKEEFINACGEAPQVDDEFEMQNVRVKVTGVTHNEWTNEIDLSVMSLDGVTESDDTSTEETGETKGRKGK